MEDKLVAGYVGGLLLAGFAFLFASAHVKVAAIEGGYVNDPVDRGGETNLGITAETAARHGIDDVKEITPARSAEIYNDDYWTVLRLDDVSAIAESSYVQMGQDLYAFGVNAGPGRAGRALQRCLNLMNNRGRLYPDIAVDGVIGPQTLRALQAYSDSRPTWSGEVFEECVRGVIVYHYIRLAEGDPSQERYLAGWMYRVWFVQQEIPE